jgi:predicted nucleic acid-binding protein
VLEIICSTRDDETEAISLVRKYSDPNASFTDCLSFVMMKRDRLTTAFTVDHHFVHAGFRAIGPS